MRNKILIGILLIGAFSLGVLSVRAYDDYQSQQVVKAQAATVAREKAIETENARVAKEAAEKKQIKESCLSLQAVYEKLTPFQKTQATKPNCNLSQVE